MASRPALAPIALFVYNRPKHTLATLKSLSANALAAESELYVFADGPKTNASRNELRRIERTRAVVRSAKWCGAVRLVEQSTNKGLAASILDAVTNVMHEHGRVIVLEDDLVTSPGFLMYMNQALDMYEEDETVMQVSGWCLPISGLPDSFFYTHATSWGWGTWARAWEQLDRNDARLLQRIRSAGRNEEFDLDGAYPFSSHLERNANGTLTTWAIKLVASIFLARGLCLYPGRSLIRNIGIDGSGVHSGRDPTYKIRDLADAVTVQRIPLVADVEARARIAEFYKVRESILARRTAVQRSTDLARSIMSGVRRRL